MEKQLNVWGMIKILTIREVELIAYRMAKKLMEWNEPIPDFSTRFPNILESSLGVPFQTFGKKLLYKGLMEKASMLFYLMIKNHPFQNGNKRIAITTLFVFLGINGKWLNIDNQGLYNFALWVAQSSPEFKDQVVSSINKFVKTHIIPFPK